MTVSAQATRRRLPAARIEDDLPGLTGQAEVVGALYAVAAAAARGDSDPPGIARMAIDHAARLLDMAGGVVFIWDDTAGLLMPVYETDSAATEAPLEPGRGMIGIAFETGAPAVVEDYRAWKGRVKSSEARGMAGAVAVPMMGDQGPMGALGLWDYQPRRFREDEVHLLSLFASHLAPVLEGARTRQARLRQVAIFKALHELSVAGSGVLEPAALGQLVVDQAKALLLADSSTLRWWDEGTGRLTLLASNDPNAPLFEPRTEPEAGASGLAFRSRGPVVLADYKDFPHPHRGSEGWDRHSVVAVPLVVRDRAVGSLVAVSREPDQFHQEDARTLSLLAAQVAPALLSAQLLQERSYQVTGFQALYDVAVAASGVLEPEALMDLLVDRARQLLRADHATLVLWDPREAMLVCVRDTAGKLTGTRLHPGDGASGRAYQIREPVRVEDYAAWERSVPSAVDLGYRSAIAVPMLSHNGPIGTLSVLSLKPRTFGGDEVKQMSLLAALVAPALESAHLHADLAASEARFRGLYETMSIGILVHAPDGTIIDANLQATRILRCPRLALVGKKLSGSGIAVFDEQGSPVEELERPTRLAAVTRLAVRNRVHRYRLSDDSAIWLKVDAVPVVNEGGQLTQVVTSLLDITELKSAEAELSESRRRLQAVVEHCPVVLFSADREGTITLLEGSALKLLGIKPQDHLGTSILGLYRDNDTVSEHLRRGREGESGTFLQAVASRLLEVRYGPMRDPSGEVVGVTGVGVDVTERRRAREAERESEAKSRFLAAMSHELRTPLNSILGFAQLLASEEFGSLTDRQRRYIGHVESSGRHLLELINDVLDLSKVQAGQMDIHLEDVEAGITVREAVNRIRPLARAKRLGVRIDCPSRLKVRADRLRLVQILLNLLSNAVKFTNEGGAVEIRARRLAGKVVFTVTDNGIGIEASHQAQIFEDFVQVESGPSRHHEGTGLGLPLSRRLAGLMGGDLTVVSSLGIGSSFSLELAAPHPHRRRPARPTVLGG